MILTIQQIADDLDVSKVAASTWLCSYKFNRFRLDTRPRMYIVNDDFLYTLEVYLTMRGNKKLDLTLKRIKYMKWKYREKLNVESV